MADWEELVLELVRGIAGVLTLVHGAVERLERGDRAAGLQELAAAADRIRGEIATWESRDDEGCPLPCRSEQLVRELRAVLADLTAAHAAVAGAPPAD
ncbi:MAG: hypothetical protein ACP5G2_07745 [Candidatus Bipolaricaulaceae bacterium]